ncbi:MAG: hypothetical protein M3Y87_14780 [Myxococcota bacterium]|nr:hypothetical protein [Myxococcota bacterium]
MAHRWKFVRVGGFDQVDIRSGADLEALHTLDQKLWVALACPTKGTELDERTLALIDGDGDGRIRAPDLLAAVKWACAMMKSSDDLTKGADGVALDAIDQSTDEGKLLVSTASTLLESVGKPNASTITVDDTTKAVDAFAKQPRNGDGVVPEAAVPDDATKAVVRDVLACTAAPEKDRSGEPGVTAASLEAFFRAIDARAAWLAKGEDTALRPLGEATPAAYAAYVAVRAKVEDYFARAKIAAYDPRALAAINGEEKQYLELCAKDLSVSAAEIATLPIVHVVPGQPLSLAKGVNPAWEERMGAFVSNVVTPLLGARGSITERDFAEIRSKLAAHDAWIKEKPVAPIDALSDARIVELAAGDSRNSLAQLIADDRAKEPEAKAIESVEKLTRLHRDLITLVNNFVSFRDFYARSAPAIFQVGTLYLDQRACELCVRVGDPARHVTMAPLANAYLVYADLKNAKGETMQIAAALTAGTVDNVMVGRNGLFYDRKGTDWDATVTRIVDNPISVRQAFWSPYTKALRMIEEQVAKRAADEATASDAAVTDTIGAAQASTATGEVAAPASRGRFDVGTIAALGVAVGGITAALGMMLAAFFGLGLWMPLGVVGLILCISGPSMAIAWLKLRKRNLGPILDANGWAVNAQAMVNVPLGRSLTRLAVLPPGSSRDVSDPFAEKRRPWRFYAFLFTLLVLTTSWYLGKVDRFLPDVARSTTVLGELAPAGVPLPARVEAPAPPATP